jgi:UDP-N-acetylmuramoyl-tripeptide--D-alanyl-D-alanine ligase
MLAALAKPSVAIVTNAQREHMEFMQTVEAVAAENASVYDTLPAQGTAVWNADDPQAAFFRGRAAGHRPLDFALDGRGRSDRAPTRSDRCRARFACARRRATRPRRSRLPECTTSATRSLLRPARSPRGFRRRRSRADCTISGPIRDDRRSSRSRSGATLINDSYNANPDSVRAAIDVLAAAGTDTLLVLGDMGEVGEQGPDFHLEVGRYAAEKGVRGLYALGEQTVHAVAGFGTGARHFASIEELIKAVRAASARDATLLVKGSRFMRMERVVAALAPAAGGAH